MDRRRVLVGLGTVSTLTLAGCADDDDSEEQDSSGDQRTDTETGGDDQSGDDSTDDESQDDDHEETDSDPEVAVEDQQFEGSGVDLIPDVQTASGLVITEATHTGSGDFVVELVGEYTPDRLLREGGELDAEWAYTMSLGADDDVRELEVTADGDWEVTLRHPRPETGEELPTTLTGDGRGVYGPYVFSGGHSVDATHDGESNFIVNVFPVTDDPYETAINTIGEYDDEEAFSFLDVGYIEVLADGEWTLDLE